MKGKPGMTAPRHVDLSLAHQRRTAWQMVLRSGLCLVLILALYYALPLESSTVGALVGLFAGLFAVGVVLAYEVRKITTSPFPAVRAVGALIVGVPLFVLLFASVYLILAGNVPGSFNQPLDRTGALYFACTVFTTVGFGDIVPVTTVARAITTIQMFLDLVAIGVAVKIIFGAVQIGLRRRDAMRERDQKPPQARS
jgi:voltage-gated potassium channel